MPFENLEIKINHIQIANEDPRKVFGIFFYYYSNLLNNNTKITILISQVKAQKFQIKNETCTGKLKH